MLWVRHLRDERPEDIVFPKVTLDIREYVGRQGAVNWIGRRAVSTGSVTGA